MDRCRRSFRPVVEALSSREMPAAGVVQSGATLTVTGTTKKDVVQIAEFGLNQVQVQIGKKPVKLFDNVGAIVVKTLGGNDQVAYTIQTLTTNDRSVTVDLGTGNDVFQGAWSGTALGTNTSIWVNGHNGTDQLSFAANGVIPSGETLGVSMVGGRGVDVIYQSYTFSLQGQLNAFVDGGRENDSITVQATAQTGDQGNFVGRVSGGVGNDNMILTLTQPSDPNLPWWESNLKVVKIDGVVDGGAGKDAASVTQGVQVFNLP